MKRVILMVTMVMLLCGTCYARTVDEARVLLLQSRIDFNEENFFAKIEQGDNFMVSLFVDAGIDVNYKSQYGNSPLKVATLYNNVDAVKLLLDRPDINVNSKDNSGKTALDAAYTMGNNEIIDLFKDKNADQTVFYTDRLADFQLRSAIAVGKTATNDKKDIVYAEKDTDKTYGGFLGADIQTWGRSYWITPYCEAANESLISSKKYDAINQNDLKRLSNTYQCRVILGLVDANIKYWDNGKFIATQKGKVIMPYSVSIVPTQITQQATFLGPAITWYRTGFIANFLSCDIAPNTPIEIKFISDASKELTFHFKNDNPKDFHQEESDEFKW